MLRSRCCVTLPGGREDLCCPGVPALTQVCSPCSEHKNSLRLLMPLLEKVVSLGLTVFLSLVIA